MNPETVIPLAEAARLLGVSHSSVQQHIKSGRIHASKLPGGEIMVRKRDVDATAINEQLSKIARDQFKGLAGVPITISDAEKKYSIQNRTIRYWIQSGFVSMLSNGQYPALIDEGDLAYCAAVYHIRQKYGILKVPLLNADGTPYTLLHPKLSAYRRNRRKP